MRRHRIVLHRHVLHDRCIVEAGKTPLCPLDAARIVACQGCKCILGVAVIVAGGMAQQNVNVRSMAVTARKRVCQDLSDDGVRLSAARRIGQAIDRALVSAVTHVAAAAERTEWRSPGWSPVPGHGS